MPVRRAHIRRVAEQLLSRSGITKPPVDVVKIARSLKVDVRPAPTDDELSGFLIRDAEGSVATIGVNNRHSSARQRFTIGHELGHYLLHRGERLHVDQRGSGFAVHRPDNRSSTGEQEEEIEANLFAAELLMPIGFLDADLAQEAALDIAGERQLARLAKRYGVSAQALTFRLANLGYIAL